MQYSGTERRAYHMKEGVTCSYDSMRFAAVINQAFFFRVQFNLGGQRESQVVSCHTSNLKLFCLTMKV